MALAVAAWATLMPGIKRILAIPFLKRVPKELYRKRMAVCRECPIFYRPLQTCGSPLVDKWTGCFCFMPLKARLTENCFAYDSSEGNNAVFGWPAELNSFPYGIEHNIPDSQS